jgi:hypothetical protein
MVRLPAEKVYAWMRKARQKLEGGHSYLAMLILEGAVDVAEEQESALPKEYYLLMADIHETELVRRFRQIEDMYDGKNPGYKNTLGDLAFYFTYMSFKEFLKEAEVYVQLPQSLLELRLGFDTYRYCVPFSAKLTSPDSVRVALMFNNVERALENQPWYQRADERLKRAGKDNPDSE